jgi:hypothetical protein
LHLAFADVFSYPSALMTVNTQKKEPICTIRHR